jgi:hypothetical protein
MGGEQDGLGGGAHVDVETLGGRKQHYSGSELLTLPDLPLTGLLSALYIGARAPG